MRNRIILILVMALVCRTVAVANAPSYTSEPVKRTGYHPVTSEPFAKPIRRSGYSSGNFAPTVREYRYGRTNHTYSVSGNSAVTVDIRRTQSRSFVASETFIEPVGDRMNSAARGSNGSSQGPNVAPFEGIGDMILLDRKGNNQGPYGMGDPEEPPVGDAVLPLLLLVGLLLAVKRIRLR